jgi:MFS family permease
VGGLAQNEAMLLGSRGLQGLGAALASPSALALITTTFPAGPARNRAFSIFAAMAGVGAAIGLILGGWLTGIDPQWGWRLTFLINVPIGLATAFLAPRVLNDSEHHSDELDVPGAVIGTGGLLALVFGITRTGNQDALGHPYGWGDPLALTAMILGVVLLVGFVILESRTKHPLMPVSIFFNRNRAVAFLTMMITPAAMFSMFFFLSLYIQNVMGYAPLKAGFAFLPFCFGLIAGATIGSTAIARINPRYITGVGTLLAGFSLFMFHRLSADDSAQSVLNAAQGGAHLGHSVSYWLDVAPYIVTMSLGMGLVFVPMTLIAVHGLRQEDAGIGSGVLNTMQQIGGAIGLATLSTVASHVATSHGASVSAAVAQVGGANALQNAAVQKVIGFAAFSHGATTAFLTGAFMIWAASVLIWGTLNVKHEELATEEVPEVVEAVAV